MRYVDSIFFIALGLFLVYGAWEHKSFAYLFPAALCIAIGVHEARQSRIDRLSAGERAEGGEG